MADLMLREVEAFLLGQRCLQVARTAEQAGLALLADAALDTPACSEGRGP
jgi:hypothetical protein